MHSSLLKLSALTVLSFLVITNAQGAGVKVTSKIQYHNETLGPSNNFLVFKNYAEKRETTVPINGGSIDVKPGVYNVYVRGPMFDDNTVCKPPVTAIKNDMGDLNVEVSCPDNRNCVPECKGL